MSRSPSPPKTPEKKENPKASVPEQEGDKFDLSFLQPDAAFFSPQSLGDPSNHETPDRPIISGETGDRAIGGHSSKKSGTPKRVREEEVVESKKIKQTKTISEKSELVTKIVGKMVNIGIKIIIMDCDLTIFKISSSDGYPINRLPKEKLKDEHDADFLKNKWFADYEFLAMFLERCNSVGIAMGLASRQSLNIIGDAFNKVGLMHYFMDNIAVSQKPASEAQKIGMVIEMIEKATKSGGKAFLLDDDKGMLKTISSEMGDKILTHHVVEDFNNKDNCGLTFARWQLIDDDLLSKEVDTKSAQKELAGRSPRKASASPFLSADQEREKEAEREF